MIEIKKNFLDKEYLKELKKPIYEGTMGFFFNNTVAGVGDKRIQIVFLHTYYILLTNQIVIYFNCMCLC